MPPAGTSRKHPRKNTYTAEEVLRRYEELLQICQMLPQKEQAKLAAFLAGNDPRRLRFERDAYRFFFDSKYDEIERRNRKPSPDTIEKDKEIAEMLAGGELQKNVARHFGMNKRNVRRAKRRHEEREERKPETGRN
jgi:hypothetical protein